jgi:CheY-like chemotaxis protein
MIVADVSNGSFAKIMGSSSVIDADYEHARLAVLQRYGIVDTPPEPQFDEIVRLAAQSCKTPVAALTLVDAAKCWFKAKTGMEVSELPREGSYCSYEFRSSGIFVVPDARHDQRFSRSPIVTANGLIFYAGAPLIASSGHSIGTLCVLDREPRELSPEQIATLQELSKKAMKLIEQRRPQTAAPVSVSTPPMGGSANPMLGRRLLVVDDDDAVRAFVCLATRRLGYDVVEANNGEEALRKLSEQPVRINLVLTDVNMPVMDGLDLVRALKKQPAPPAIAVMSGRFDPYIRSALRTEGVTALMGKPFSTEELKLTLLRAQTTTTA